MSLRVPNWLNPNFVEKILRDSESDNTIEVKSAATKSATENGDNYMSDMIRVTVEYTRYDNSHVITETKSLIFKIAPSLGGANHELVKEIGAFTTEIQMMKNTLVKMNDALNDKDCRLSARALYSETGDTTFLVIEDLAPIGYRMANRQAGLDLQHCILAMRGLARFHASSVAVCEKEPKQKLFYTRGVFHKDNPETLKTFFADGIKMLALEVANWSELGSSANDYSQKLLKLSKVCYEKASILAKPRDGEFNVINHGDFWVNNMLFQYNEEGNVTNHIFVDFQTCIWTTPAIDILHFLSTSASQNVYSQHRESLIEEYLKLLTETMIKLGCKTTPPSMIDLQESLINREFISVLSSSLGLAFALIAKSETKKLDDMLNESGGYLNPAYKGQTYRKMMLSRLKLWNTRGLLDS